MRIGITGTIGSGKSTILNYFKTKGYKTIDSDALVKDLLSNNAQVISSVQSEFGESVFHGKNIDPKSLAAIVFNNPVDLHKLEGILHPPVIEYIKEAMESEPTQNWAVEIPLLFEKKLEALFDKTICVIIKPELQEQRLSKRGISPEETRKRTSRQFTQDKKSALADYTINNDGDTGALTKKLEDLLKEIS